MTLEEIKELIVFGRAQGLQSMQVQGCSVVFGAPSLPESVAVEKPEDIQTSNLPPELRHYSALGKAAWGKRE